MKLSHTTRFGWGFSCLQKESNLFNQGPDPLKKMERQTKMPEKTLSH